MEQKNKGIKNGIEGIAIIALGVFFLYNSLIIRSNPIQYGNWTDIMAQAKLLPITLSCIVIVLGIILLIRQMRGTDVSVTLATEEWKRLFVVLVLVAAYCVGVYYMKFMIPTLLFSFAIMLFLNLKKRKLWWILVLAALAFVLGCYGMPRLINLNLPLR